MSNVGGAVLVKSATSDLTPGIVTGRRAIATTGRSFANAAATAPPTNPPAPVTTSGRSLVAGRLIARFPIAVASPGRSSYQRATRSGQTLETRPRRWGG